jgi:hypothetical protein
MSKVKNIESYLQDNTLISTPEGSSITLERTSVYGASRLWLQSGENLKITGGKHFTLTVTGNKHQADPNPGSTVTLTGNMLTCGLTLATVAGDKACTHDECLTQPDMALRGTWAALDATLIGNLDVWLEQSNRPTTITALDNLRYGYSNKDKVHEKVCFYGVKADYSLWHLLHSWDRAKDAHKGTLKASYMLLRNGAEIKRFCAFKDAHIEPNCKCALYYPLLLEGNSLALAYYLRAQGAPRSRETLITQSIPKTMLEDNLEASIRSGLEFQFPGVVRVTDERAQAVKKLKTVEQFKKVFKRLGVDDISTLYAPFIL